MSAAATAATPSNPSYVERAISVTITLGTGTFGETGFNAVKLSGLRVLCTIQKGGMPSMDQAEIRVYGVQPSIMNAVTTLGVPIPMLKFNNTVLVEAGDAINGMAVVYSGYLGQCWQNLDGSPETFLNIIGLNGAPAAMQPTPPLSFAGTADVATIMSGIATRAGWAFENNGVTAKLSNPYFPGTALEQAHNVARAANIEMYLDSGTGPTAASSASPAGGTGVATPTATLAIWPKTGTRGGQIPLISMNSGLVGYPRWFSQGLQFRTLFNPNIRIGGQIKLQSTIGGQANTPAAGTTPTPAGGPNGTWLVCSPLSYDLAAQVPGGPWYTDVSCTRLPGAPGT
jgi:hypothetical protein